MRPRRPGVNRLDPQSPDALHERVAVVAPAIHSPPTLRLHVRQELPQFPGAELLQIGAGIQANQPAQTRARQRERREESHCRRIQRLPLRLGLARHLNRRDEPVRQIRLEVMQRDGPAPRVDFPQRPQDRSSRSRAHRSKTSSSFLPRFLAIPHSLPRPTDKTRQLSMPSGRSGRHKPDDRGWQPHLPIAVTLGNLAMRDPVGTGRGQHQTRTRNDLHDRPTRSIPSGQLPVPAGVDLRTHQRLAGSIRIPLLNR